MTFRTHLTACTGALIIAMTFITPAAADIRIAVVGAFSGQFSRLGDMMREGAEAAVREINDDGGVLGETISLQFFDDKCDPEQAESAALASLAAEAIMVIGHTCSIATEAALPVYAEKNIALFMPVSSAPRLTDENAAAPVFRTAPRSDDEAREVTAHLLAAFPDGGIALLDDASVYSIGLASSVETQLETAGVPVDFKETISPGTVDYSGLISELLESDVKAVFFAGYPIDAALMIKALRELAPEIRFFGSETILTEDFGIAAGGAADGAVLFAPVDPRLSDDVPPKIRRLTEKGVEPYLTVLSSYAAIEAWALAVSASGTFEAGALNQALENGRFSTIRGLMSFDEKGDSVLRSYQPYIWTGDWVEPLN